MSIVVVALLAMIAWVAVGCGGSSGEGRAIALLLPNDEATSYTNMTRDRPEFESEVADLCGGCQVIYRNAQGSAARQQKQAEEAIARGAVVLVVNPVNTEKASEIVQNANVHQVPVVAYNSLIYNARLDYYVDTEDAAIGKAQAAFLAEKLKEMGKPHGPLAALTLSRSGPVNTGAHEIFASSGLEVADERDMFSYLLEAPVTKSEREMKQLIKAIGPGGFGGVYAFDDKAAEGAIKAMKSAGIDPAERPTTGAGAMIPALQRILAGEQAMTVYEANQEVTDATAELAVELAEGDEVSPSEFNSELANGFRDVPGIVLKPTAVTKGNIKKTMIDSGFVDPVQLCTGDYAKYCKELGIEPA